MIESTLLNLIDYIREELPSYGSIDLPGERERQSAPPLTVGLARFQSYRGRTEAALVQELTDHIDEAGLDTLNFKVLDEESVVILW